MLDQYTGDLASWTEQVLVIASVGLLLPMVLRIRHPKTQLAYCHALLAVCLLAPAVQPWLHPVVISSGADSGAGAALATDIAHRPSTGAAASTSLQRPDVPRNPDGAARPVLPIWKQVPAVPVLLWILAAGAAGKLCWLLASLWRIRTYRIAATPLYPIPESVRAASAATHADAVFCISPDITGPVMLGWLAPVVLLPECFLALDEEAQCAIACHELLHVRRHDWLITVFEELAGALVWFNPAIWLLLAKTRLVREQLVDEEVVRLTGARELYIEALLAIARERPSLDLAPAPLFLRRRHLTQRMHSLLKELTVSKFRLFSSYVSIAAILAFAGSLAVATFPLIGSPQFQEAAAPSAIPQHESDEQEASQTLPRNAHGATPAAAGLSSAPVPADPHELVTGAVQVASSPADRLAALNLLRRAESNGVVHGPRMNPFSFKVTFTATGNLSYTGPGELTELWMSGQNWRLTENIGNYSLVRLGHSGLRADEQPVSLVPMRSHMMRNEVTWAMATNNPGAAQIRTSAAQWNGKPVTCILLSDVTGPAAQTQSRLWEENEYCVANDSGLLQIHSIAPGVYAVFDYGKNLQFHGRTMADRVTIYLAGTQVVDGDFSISDPTPNDPSLLELTPQMVANARPVIPMTEALIIPVDVPGSTSGSVIQPVVIHAQLDGQGNVLETELSATANPSLTQSALDLVKQMKFGPAIHAYVNVRFVPASR